MIQANILNVTKKESKTKNKEMRRKKNNSWNNGDFGSKKNEKKNRIN